MSLRKIQLESIKQLLSGHVDYWNKASNDFDPLQPMHQYCKGRAEEAEDTINFIEYFLKG